MASASQFRSSLNSMNDKFAANDTSRPKVNRNLAECCYSVSNLAIIVASIIALIVLVQFMQDDILYEYGEHLLSLRFYRQLIYIIVIIPLVLLLPIFNAASAFFHKHELNRSVINARLFYQISMLILVLVGLIFVAPSTRTRYLSSQIELELRKHMKYRYENSFSYEFLDRLQEQYECCDELWYRANLHDNLPTSCFVPDGTYSLIYDETCPYAIGSLVSTRCSLLAMSLVAIIVALVTLISIDIRELITPTKSRQYEVTASDNYTGSDGRPSQNNSHTQFGTVPKTASLKRQIDDTRSSRRLAGSESVDVEPTDVHLMTDDDDEDVSIENLGHADRGRREANQARNFNNRLNSGERRREAPLIQGQDDERGAADAGRAPLPVRESSPTTILTRANYELVRRERSQSPVFVGKAIERQQPVLSNSNNLPIKSALKKSTSHQRLHDDDDLATIDDQLPVNTRPMSPGADRVEDAESLDEYAARLRSSSLIRLQRDREQQAKRSIMNVRFAAD